jgi:hypothetical protein
MIRGMICCKSCCVSEALLTTVVTLAVFGPHCFGVFVGEGFQGDFFPEGRSGGVDLVVAETQLAHCVLEGVGRGGRLLLQLLLTPDEGHLFLHLLPAGCVLVGGSKGGRLCFVGEDVAIGVALTTPQSSGSTHCPCEHIGEPCISLPLGLSDAEVVGAWGLSSLRLEVVGDCVCHILYFCFVGGASRHR